MTIQDHFRELFWDAFHRPKFLSERYRVRWEDLESLNDLLAGPFFSIYENGNCDYVFTDKKRFSFINSPEDFIAWLHKLCFQYRAAVEELVPADAAEEHDFNMLRYQCDMKDELGVLTQQLYSEKVLNQDENVQ